VGGSMGRLYGEAGKPLIPTADDTKMHKDCTTAMAGVPLDRRHLCCLQLGQKNAADKAETAGRAVPGLRMPSKRQAAAAAPATGMLNCNSVGNNGLGMAAAAALRHARRIRQQPG